MNHNEKNRVRIVDFAPHNVNEVLAELHRLNNTGDIAGVMFVAKLKSREKPVFGMSGSCIDNKMAAIGAATHLLHAVTARSMEG